MRLNWLNKILNKTSQRIGLKLDSSSLHYCLFDPESSAPKIQSAARVPVTDQNREEVFLSTMQQLNVRGREAYFVLPDERYRIITVERPAVPDEELKEALQWQIKDLIDIPMDEAVFTHFDYPESVPGATRVSVVVAEKREIERLIEFTTKAGLVMRSIGIQELIMGQLVGDFLQEGQNVAFLTNTSQGLSVHCFLGDQFVFTRALANTFLPFSSTEETTFELDLDEAPLEPRQFDVDSFLLEVQRTLDYYESQIAKRSITTIVLPYLGKDNETVTSTLSTELGLQVKTLKLDDLCRWSDEISEINLYRELSVCATALQDLEVTDATS